MRFQCCTEMVIFVTFFNDAVNTCVCMSQVPFVIFLCLTLTVLEASSLCCSLTGNNCVSV